MRPEGEPITGAQWWRPGPARLPVRAFNAVGRRRTPRPFDPADLVAEAQHRTRLSDLGEPMILEGLWRLCESFEREARLSALGRYVARGGLLAALQTRLRLVDLFERVPAITAQPVSRPIFVVGLPRTGTTLLHRLLAHDDRHRAPLWWEGAQPCPPPATVSARPDPRIREAERALRSVSYVVPPFRAIHESASTEPEECVQLMGNDLVSLVFAIQYRVPSYTAWLEGTDLTPAYENHRRQLQVLQWQAPPARWICKAPAHLFGLPALLRAYPDAIVVQTHRAPEDVVASTCSLIATAQSVCSDAVDPIDVGEFVLGHLSAWLDQFAVDRALTDSDPRSEATFVDVEYGDLIADPAGTCRRIYEASRIDSTATAEQSVRAYLAAHPQHRFGRHSYSLSQFGLTEADVGRAFRRETSVAGAVSGIVGDVHGESAASIRKDADAGLVS